MLKAISHFHSALSALVLMAGCSGALAQTSADKENEADSQGNELHFAVAQKFWYASFESTPLVARMVIPAGGSTPVAQASLDSSTSSKLMPITAVSASWKDLSLSASGSPRTSFSNPDAPNGSVSRDEYDFAIAYAILHSNEGRSRLSVLADYKIGEVRPITGTSAATLLGVQGNVRVSAFLFGLSGVSPIATVGGRDLSLYGNAAFGTGHSRFTTPLIHTLNTHYSIAEVGLSCLLGNAFSIQLGYRTQSFTLRNVPFVTLSTSSPGTILSSESRNVESSTQGPIVGITASF